MKIFAGTLLAAACAMGSAHAQVVTFDFTAKVTFMNEYDGQTFTEVTSSMISGLDVAHGDLLHGRFSFDIATPLSPLMASMSNSPVQVYEGPQHPVRGSITFDRPAYTFTSTNPFASSIAVRNDRFGDMFSVQTGEYTQDMTQTRSMAIHLFDDSGAALSSAAIPGSLSLPAFDTALVSYGWRRASDGVQFNSSAIITSMTQVVTSPVPEPSTYAMFAVGLLALGAVARRKAAAQP